MAEYAAEHGVNDAAAKFKVCYATVYHACREYGIRPPRNYRKTAATSSFTILRRLLDGASQKELAGEFGITRQRVHQIAERAKEAGFEIPKKT